MKEQRAVGCGLHFWFRWAGSESEWVPVRCLSHFQGARTRPRCPTHPIAYVITACPSSPAFRFPRTPVREGQPWATWVRFPSGVFAVGQPGSSPRLPGSSCRHQVPPATASRLLSCTTAVHIPRPTHLMSAPDLAKPQICASTGPQFSSPCWGRAPHLLLTLQRPP